MDGAGNRTEAERWLFTANKLLSARDLHGARSFAIRARESDPTFDAIELLMTVIDTVLAGETLINDRHRDWYGILQIVRYTTNIDEIAEKYRRLALLLDPHRNPFALTSHAFSLVHDAWSILSDSVKKAVYDDDLRLFTSQTPPPQQPPPPPQPQPQQKKNLRPKNVSTKSGRNTRTELDRTEVEEASFWTSCPYCYVMYEYPKVYEECTLRCQNCRRGFHAVVIRSPPLNGLDESFCTWGFLPLGFSGDSNDINGVGSNWNPFSPLFPCSLKGSTKKKKDWVYYDDEVATAFINISDPSDGDSDGDWIGEKRRVGKKAASDGDWRGGKKRVSKRTRSSRKNASEVKTEPVRRRRRRSQGGGAGNENTNGGAGNENAGGAGSGSVAVSGDAGSVSVGGGGGGSVAAGAGGIVAVGGGGAGSVAVVAGGTDSVAVDGVAPALPDGLNANAGISKRAQLGKRGAAGGPRRRGAGSLGKLDLNVEFSNDAEERQEPSQAGMREGHPTGNADDNIYGIGFFDGLDEFLSSLPVLNVVGDDKVKDP